MAYVEPVTTDEETQRKLKETALSLEAVVEHANSIIIRWDRNHRIIYFNSFAEKFFGYSQDEVIGQPIQSILPRLDGSGSEADGLPDAIVRHPERFIHNDNENITKDGRRVWIRWTNRAIFDHDDELQEILAIGNDITDRKKLELQLLKTHEELEQRVHRRTRELAAAKEKLEHLVTELAEKNEELERFTYTVSHDLRSPLITIQTFAEMVQEDASSGQIDHIVQDAERIVVASEKMMGLLDGLLELSRIGRFMNPPEAVPFREIVEDALVMMAGQLAEHGAQVDVRDDLPTVWGDRRRLVQVMQNLLDNAVKFRTSDAPPRIEIGVAPDRDSQALFVKDNGIGIETDDRTRIFGLFKKLTAETSGVGVGLALVARIIAFHEGEIWVESEGKGKGSTFFFTIPSPP
jgi:PAS domain S-box-containing protein